jgi:hypothetical protein
VRRILASLFTIVALLAVGVFATGAYFTSPPIPGGMTITSGTAALEVTPWSGFPEDTSNVYPGWTSTTCIKITNDGTVPLYVRQTVNSVGAVGLWDSLNLSIVAGAGCGSGPTVASGTLHQFQGNIYLLAPAALAPGGVDALYVTQTIWFPETGVPQNDLQTLSIDVSETFYGQTN